MSESTHSWAIDPDEVVEQEPLTDHQKVVMAKRIEQMAEANVKLLGHMRRAGVDFSPNDVALDMIIALLFPEGSDARVHFILQLQENTHRVMTDIATQHNRNVIAHGGGIMIPTEAAS